MHKSQTKAALMNRYVNKNKRSLNFDVLHTEHCEQEYRSQWGYIVYAGSVWSWMLDTEWVVRGSVAIATSWWEVWYCVVMLDNNGDGSMLELGSVGWRLMAMVWYSTKCGSASRWQSDAELFRPTVSLDSKHTVLCVHISIQKAQNFVQIKGRFLEDTLDA